MLITLSQLSSRQSAGTVYNCSQHNKRGFYARLGLTGQVSDSLRRKRCFRWIIANSSDSTGSEQRQKVSQPDDKDTDKQSSVSDALKAAQAALTDAEEQLAHVELLPSAKIPWEMPSQLAAFLRLSGLVGIAALFWWSQMGGVAARLAGSLGAGALIGWLGLAKGSLSVSGALAATVVGGGTLAASFRCGATLLAFYFSSSRLTALAESRKETDDAFKPGGQRDWKQVCSNALIPLVAALALVPITGGADILLSSAVSRDAVCYLGAFFGYYACCCGDTWASELGQLSSSEPRLITTMRPVRRGTNGGVTPLGFAASAGGGLLVGLAFWGAALISPTFAGTSGTLVFHSAGLQQWRLIPLGAFMGLVGSLVDSVLGATVQFSGLNRETGRVTSQYSSSMVPIAGIPLLSNNAVNVVSASCSAIICSLLCLRLF